MKTKHHKLQMIIVLASISLISLGIVNARSIADQHTQGLTGQKIVTTKNKRSAPVTSEANTLKAKHIKEEHSALSKKQLHSFVPSTTVATQVIDRLIRQVGVSGKKSGGSVLTGYQIVQLLQDTKVNTPQEAAVIAALFKANNLGTKKNQDFGPYAFSESALHEVFTKQSLIKKFSDPSTGLYLGYKNALKQIEDVRKLPEKSKLFGHDGITSSTHLMQGAHQDCYLVAPVNALINSKGGPKLLEKMITQTGPNTFVVNFPHSSKTIPVTLTEAELGAYNTITNGNYGKWLAVLTIAVSEFRYKDKEYNPEIFGGGGSATYVLHILTGRKYDAVLLNQNNPLTSAQNLNSLISQTLKLNLPVGIATQDHVLSIHSIDLKTGTVTVDNPWGDTGPYTLNGVTYHMKHGLFTVPIKDLTAQFYQISIPNEILPKTPAVPTTPPG